MKYKVFECYTEFKYREDKSINGFSQEFIDYMGINDFDYMVNHEDFATNSGCWNCLYCMDCENCVECSHCDVCKGCDYCESCYDCNGSYHTQGRVGQATKDKNTIF